MASKIKWGILGTGMIGNRFAEAVRDSELGVMHAIGSRSQPSADQFAEKHSVPNTYDSYDKLLADAEVDAVYISLPNHLHAEWAIKAAEAGKHILLEKPFATNEAELELTLQAVERGGVFLMEAFMYRCHPQTAKIHEVIASGAIGEVRVIEANFAFNLGEAPDNIRLRNDAAGGGIMDVGGYCMSMARLIAGAATGQPFAEPVSVQGVAHLGEQSRVDEYATASAAFPGDVIATLTCGNQCHVDWGVWVWGSEGHLHIPNPWFPGEGENELLIHKAGEEEPDKVVVTCDKPLYSIEADILAAAVADGETEAPTPCMTWKDSVGNQNALDEWRRSIGLTYDLETTDALAVRPLHLPAKNSTNMPFGEIEGIDKPVARTILGSMVMDTQTMPRTFALMDQYLERGGNTIDTAWVYVGGRSEVAVGQYIRARGIRDDLVLIGKGGATPECYPEGITAQLMQTLDRFGLDYLDLYMLHRDNTDLPVSELVDCLAAHQRAGRIGAYGGSNWTVERLAEANAYAKAKGLMPMVASSPNFTLAHWNEPMWEGCVTAVDEASRQWYAQTNTALLAWSSQASGFFTGRFSRADSDNPAVSEVVRVWFNEQNFQRLERVNELAAALGVSPASIALAYVLAQPMNMYALIGPRTPREIDSSLAALDIELTTEQVAYLELKRDAMPAV